MKSKKVTMLAAALVVAVVAAAGIGYAATAYTAETTNSNNTAEATYLIIDQGDGATAYGEDWLTNVFFNTENTAHGVNTWTMKKEYKNNDGAIAKTAEGPTMALISGILPITVTGHNSSDDSLVVTVTTSDLKTSTQVPGLTYYIALGTATTTEGVISMTGAVLVPGEIGANGTTWTFPTVTAEDGTASFALLMFIGGDATATPGENAGFGETSSFVITATAEE